MMWMQFWLLCFKNIKLNEFAFFMRRSVVSNVIGQCPCIAVQCPSARRFLAFKSWKKKSPANSPYAHILWTKTIKKQQIRNILCIRTKCKHSTFKRSHWSKPFLGFSLFNGTSTPFHFPRSTISLFLRFLILHNSHYDIWHSSGPCIEPLNRIHWITSWIHTSTWMHLVCLVSHSTTFMECCD